MANFVVYFTYIEKYEVFIKEGIQEGFSEESEFEEFCLIFKIFVVNIKIKNQIVLWIPWKRGIETIFWYIYFCDYCVFRILVWICLLLVDKVINLVILLSEL